MITFISSFKRYLWGCRWIFAALLCFALIEALVGHGLTREQIEKQAERTALLEYNYLKRDVGQKYSVSYKAWLFAGAPAEFVMIGDSSGAYGVKPHIVERYLNGATLINANCCADVGWKGYAYLADYFLSHNPRAKYLLLHVTPYSMPRQFGEGFSGDVYGVFAAPYRGVYRLPSLYYRGRVLNAAYRYTPDYRAREERDVMDNLGVAPQDLPQGKSLVDTMRDTGGWLPYDVKPHRKDMPVGECGPRINEYAFGRRKQSTVPKALSRIADVAERHGVKLMVVFNPVACRDNAGMDRLRGEIEEVAAQRHIALLMPFIRTWPAASFSDEWHLNPQGAEKHSRETGLALKRWLRANGQ